QEVAPVPMENSLADVQHYYAAPWAGRVTSIVQPQTTSMLIGTAGGGIWQSNDIMVNGQYNAAPTWSPLTDKVQNGVVNTATGLGAGASDIGENAIAVIPGDPAKIVAATAGGVLRTQDGGNQWIFAGTDRSDPEKTTRIFDQTVT